MTLRRSCCCPHFCCWNWNWKQFYHLSPLSLASRRSKHWLCRNWHWHWLSVSLRTVCWRNRPPQHQPLKHHRQLHPHHRTIQAAGNQVQPAVVHMHVSGIHRHKISPTVRTIRAHRRLAVVVRQRRLPHPNHIRLSRTKQKHWMESNEICLIYICCCCYIFVFIHWHPDEVRYLFVVQKPNETRRFRNFVFFVCAK